MSNSQFSQGDGGGWSNVIEEVDEDDYANPVRAQALSRPSRRRFLSFVGGGLTHSLTHSLLPDQQECAAVRGGLLAGDAAERRERRDTVGGISQDDPVRVQAQSIHGIARSRRNSALRNGT